MIKIIDTVDKLVPSPHKVNLSNPEINIVLKIVKTVYLLGVVENYKELSKYNLRFQVRINDVRIPMLREILLELYVKRFDHVFSFTLDNN
ncbi:hypothetical protein CQW23_28308 [Capsicum baccatum]|uniref:THUMP domain-containing protein n=1 Tax=Capsicum baccatum TaxID=33114 RepID=A0A2G2VG59_CAPBA|nr:hypothetical protein CQW23_28308 [Capsicum baccatum]